MLTLRESRGSRGGSHKDLLGILEDASILIEDGLILEVGLSRRLGNLHQARAAEQLDASACLVLPAWIDGGVDLFAPPLTPASLRSRVRQLIAHGTTTVAIPSNGTPRQCESVRRMGLDLCLPAPDSKGFLRPLVSCFTGHDWSWHGQPALATGFDGSDRSTCSMQAAVALAHFIGKAPLEEALLASSLWCARRLGIDSRLGTIEPGKQADLIVLDIPDYRRIPYHLGENLVRAVVKRGVKVYERGEPHWAAES